MEVNFFWKSFFTKPLTGFNNKKFSYQFTHFHTIFKEQKVVSAKTKKFPSISIANQQSPLRTELETTEATKPIGNAADKHSLFQLTEILFHWLSIVSERCFLSKLPTVRIDEWTFKQNENNEIVFSTFFAQSQIEQILTHPKKHSNPF